MKECTIGCVILASGLSIRFGSNKLLKEFNGIPLIEHTFQKIPTSLFTEIIVVSPNEEIAKISERYGWKTLFNPHPEMGQSESVKIGTEHFISLDGILFKVGDQPLFSAASMTKLVDAFRMHPESIIAVSHQGKRGNPVIFPSKYFSELLTLTGDTGGAPIIKRHFEDLLLVEVGSVEMQDVDDPTDFQKLN